MRLLTPSGYKKIEDCVIGEQLIAYDIADGHVIINVLEGKEWVEVEEPLKFKKINGTWTLYENQSIWANLNVTHASQLQVGDVVYNDDDNNTLVSSITDVTALGWWRLTVSGDHSYIADGLTLHNASRYWVGGGSSANWNATANTNWGSASGGANNASVPTSADDVFFDGAGATGDTNSTISADISIKSLTISAGYTSTMTHNGIIYLTGNWTFHNGYIIAGTSALEIDYSASTKTITSGGKTWPNNLILKSVVGSTNYFALSGNLTVLGTLSLPFFPVNIAATTTETLTIGNGISMFSSLQGTAKIIITGGTITGEINNNLDIAGNVTFSGTVTCRLNTITYVSGTVTTTGSTLNLPSGNTLNTNGIVWNNITTSGPATNCYITLTSNLTLNGLLTIGGYYTQFNRTTTETVTLNGGLTQNAGMYAGTAEFILTGGIWSGGGYVNNDLTINGNITVSGAVGIGSKTLKYVSGTVTTTGSSLYLGNGSILNTNGIAWNNIYVQGSGGYGWTTTLTSNLLINGILYCLSWPPTINKSVSETVTCAGGINIAGSSSLGGTAKYILTGGTWTGTGTFLGTTDIQGNVTVSGSVYYGSGTLTYVSGTVTTTGSTLNIASTCTLNTNGITWNNVTFGTANTTTLTSNLSANGLMTVSAATTLNRTTAETCTVAGGLTVNAALSGTAKVILTGGTWSGSSTLSKNLDIQGNVTVSGTVYYASGTMTYVSGTVTTTGSTLYIQSTTCTLNTNGITWNNFTFAGTTTITLTSNWLVNGLFHCGYAGGLTLNKTTSETLTINGGILANASITTTALINFNGGTWYYNFGSGGTIYGSMTIGGNVTLSGVCNFANGTFTYASGTVTVAGSDLRFSGTCTLNTAPVIWNILRFSTGTFTLTSNISCSGILYGGYGQNIVINKTGSETVTTTGGLLGEGGSFSGTADIYVNGGTFGATAYSLSINNPNLYLNGDITIVGGFYITGNTLNHLSGAVGVSTNSSFNPTNCTIISNGILWNNLNPNGTITLITDLNINGTMNIGYGGSAILNRTTTEQVLLANLSGDGGSFSGTAEIVLTGGTISAGTFVGNFSVLNNLTIAGNINILTTGFRYYSGTLRYKSGRITSTVTPMIYLTGACTVLDFNKVALKSILIAASQTITMNQFFVGTPGQPCTVTSSGANYTIQFQDGFEKIAKYVAITGATITRPNQLLVVTRQRFNTNRQSNVGGIRYINQSPNGVPKGVIQISDRSLTTPALGLVSDPNFTRQG